MSERIGDVYRHRLNGQWIDWTVTKLTPRKVHLAADVGYATLRATAWRPSFFRNAALVSRGPGDA